jgi:uncharacterized membrane protein YeaQ/YmgE (transglycosylase-associated protein family)
LPVFSTLPGFTVPLWNFASACAFPAGYRIDGIPELEEMGMEDAGIGWIAAIIIGGIAGWLAEMFMKSNMGVFMNIILGIVGAAVANLLLSLIGVALGGWIGYLIAGFIGACILIAIARAIRR